MTNDSVSRINCSVLSTKRSFHNSTMPLILFYGVSLGVFLRVSIFFSPRKIFSTLFKPFIVRKATIFCSLTPKKIILNQKSKQTKECRMTSFYQQNRNLNLGIYFKKMLSFTEKKSTHPTPKPNVRT